ncbi:hypothetical protein KP509_1Z150300 [Ceratopteris richardii]|nr:hypothetical protein KP509_1Z150300 [Ceratopteris richardii]
MRQSRSSPTTRELHHLHDSSSPFRSRLHCGDCTPISKDAHCRQRLDRHTINNVDRSSKCIAGMKRKVSWLRACAMAYHFLCSTHAEQRAQPTTAYKFGKVTRPTEEIMNVHLSLRGNGTDCVQNLDRLDGTAAPISLPLSTLESQSCHDRPSHVHCFNVDHMYHSVLSSRMESDSHRHKSSPAQGLTIEHIVNPTHPSEWTSSRILSPSTLRS